MRPNPLPILSGPCLALALLLTAAGCGRRETATSIDTNSVATINLGPEDLGLADLSFNPVGIFVYGTVNPAVRVDIKAQVPGQISEMLVNRGDSVKNGQVIARFSNKTMVARVQAARAVLSAAERDQGATEVLFKAGAVSERANANAGVNVDSAKAQLAQAEETIDDAEVTSPIDGVVTERLINAGETAVPGQKLFSIINSSMLEMVSTVLPADFPFVRPGMKALLKFDSLNGASLEGEVVRLDPIADAQTRRVSVDIRINNSDRQVVPGIFGTGLIVTNASSFDKVLRIPSTAIRSDSEGIHVLLIDGDRISRRTVRLDESDAGDGMVRVVDGIPAGSRYLLNPGRSVIDGQRFNLLKPRAQRFGKPTP